jgi:hypothetical protein
MVDGAYAVIFARRTIERIRILENRTVTKEVKNE